MEGLYKGAHLHLNSHNMESALHSFIREFFFPIICCRAQKWIQCEQSWGGKVPGKRQKCGLPVPPVGKN